MNKSVIERIASNFLRAFPAVTEFEVGIRLAEENSEDGEEHMRIQSCGLETLRSAKFLKFLQAMNVQGKHIYIRPMAPHSYTLVDDVIPEKLGWCENEGLEPCAIIETSPDNFQLWFNHGQILTPEVSTQASKLLAEWFDGDPSSADFRHFGRFPGFTNPKPKYRKNGRQPFSKLQTSRHTIYSKSALVVESATQRYKSILEEEKKLKEKFNALPSSDIQLRKTWDDFLKDPRYDGDYNRVDFAYALYALQRGQTVDDVCQTLIQRDLSHKGSAGRQRDYVSRTVKKAAIRVGIS